MELPLSRRPFEISLSFGFPSFPPSSVHFYDLSFKRLTCVFLISGEFVDFQEERSLASGRSILGLLPSLDTFFRTPSLARRDHIDSSDFRLAKGA